ncbi:hypothetical protein VTK26DRAFT_5478 [Humicola hyalothermophila]
MKTPLSQLKVDELRALCGACGLKKHSRKADLIRGLRLAAKQFQPVPPTARILSIDLGLRNFAFSLISPAPLPESSKGSASESKPTRSKSKTKSTSPKTSKSHITIANPVTDVNPVYLHAWHRLDLTIPTTTAAATSAPEPPASAKAAASTQVRAELQQDPAPASDAKGKGNGDAEAAGSDAWSPAALTTVTLALVKTHLLPLRPTHILIERQRFRSYGRWGVFEWTLRVNMLEAILHAMFAGLRGEEGAAAAAAGVEVLAGTKAGAGAELEAGGKGGKKGTRRKKKAGENDYRVFSVLPQRVGTFLFPEGLSTTERRGRRTEGEREKEAAAEAMMDGDMEAEVAEAEAKWDGGKADEKRRSAQEWAKYRMGKLTKVSLMADWLTKSKKVVPKTKETREMKADFLAVSARWKESYEARVEGLSKAKAEEAERNKGEEETMSRPARVKIDDLADSVLQAAVWLQWQRNLEALIKERPELLEDEE